MAVYSYSRESPQYVRPLGEAVLEEGDSIAPKEAKVPTALRWDAGGVFLFDLFSIISFNLLHVFYRHLY